MSRTPTPATAGRKLVAEDGSPGDTFGIAVDCDAGTAIVESPADDNARGTDAGAAYVFERGTDAWTQKLTGTGGAEASFGGAVALAGDTAVVGPPTETTSAGEDAGADYVFERSGREWPAEQPEVVSAARC